MEQQIAEDILNLASNIKKDTNEIISSITARRDQFKDKAEISKCQQLDIPFIGHNDIWSEIHLKPKVLHLNFNRSDLLSDNFAAWNHVWITGRMYNERTAGKRIENLCYMDSSTILPDDTFIECTRDILGDVNSNNETFISQNERNDIVANHEITCNETESSTIRKKIEPRNYRTH